MFSLRCVTNISRRATGLLGRQGSRSMTYDENVITETEEDNESTKERPRSFEKSVNKVTLIGRVGKEGILRGTEQQPCLIVPLATNFVFKKADTGELMSKTDWHRICVFSPNVMAYAKRLGKGDRVYVEGALSYHKVTDENDKMKIIPSVIAREVTLLSRARGFDETKSDDE